MWLLILVAVHVNNPKDIPGKIEIPFPNQQACETAQSNIKWQLKFDTFKIIATCEKLK